MLPADVRHPHPRVPFLQHSNDLFFREPALPHLKSSLGLYTPEDSHFRWSSFGGQVKGGPVRRSRLAPYVGPPARVFLRVAGPCVRRFVFGRNQRKCLLIFAHKLKKRPDVAEGKGLPLCENFYHNVRNRVPSGLVNAGLFSSRLRRALRQPIINKLLGLEELAVAVPKQDLYLVS